MLQHLGNSHDPALRRLAPSPVFERTPIPRVVGRADARAHERTNANCRFMKPLSEPGPTKRSHASGASFVAQGQASRRVAAMPDNRSRIPCRPFGPAGTSAEASKEPHDSTLRQAQGPRSTVATHEPWPEARLRAPRRGDPVVERRLGSALSVRSPTSSSGRGRGNQRRLRWSEPIRQARRYHGAPAS